MSFSLCDCLPTISNGIAPLRPFVVQQVLQQRVQPWKESLFCGGNKQISLVYRTKGKCPILNSKTLRKTESGAATQPALSCSLSTTPLLIIHHALLLKSPFPSRCTAGPLSPEQLTIALICSQGFHQIEAVRQSGPAARAQTQERLWRLPSPAWRQGKGSGV